MLKQNSPETIFSARVVVTNPAQDRFLLSRRAQGYNQAGLWELPGGGIGDGESGTAAALREIREETGVIAWPTRHPEQIEYREIPDGKHAGKMYHAVGLTAVARYPFDQPRTSNETDRVGWFSREQLGALALTPTSQAALEKLLP